MNAVKYLIAFGVAPLFLLAGILKTRAALHSSGKKKPLMRQGVLYLLAALVWLLAAFGLRA
jgi:hypothetical protein